MSVATRFRLRCKSTALKNACTVALEIRLIIWLCTCSMFLTLYLSKSHTCTGHGTVISAEDEIPVRQLTQGRFSQAFFKFLLSFSLFTLYCNAMLWIYNVEIELTPSLYRNTVIKWTKLRTQLPRVIPFKLMFKPKFFIFLWKHCLAFPPLLSLSPSVFHTTPTQQGSPQASLCSQVWQKSHQETSF